MRVVRYYIIKAHTKIVQFLCQDYRTDVNLKNHQGETSLMLACRLNNFLAVKLLVANTRTKINISNSNGETALMIGFPFFLFWPQFEVPLSPSPI